MKMMSRLPSKRPLIPRISLYCFALMGIFVFSNVSQQQTVYAALSAEQKSIYRRGILHYDINGTSGCSSSVTTANTVGGDSNKERIWDYFALKGLKAEIIAGIMGNMQSESGFNEQRLQGTPVETKTPAAEAVKLSNQKGKAWGIVQWDPSSKFINSDFIVKENKNPNDLNVQLDFLWGQLTGKSIDGIIDQLKAAKDEIEAANIFGVKYERYSGPPQAIRAENATKILNDFANHKTNTTSTAQGSDTTGGKTVIYLDPGHGSPKEGQDAKQADPVTGLMDSLYPSTTPEMQNVYNVSLLVKQKLESSGYTVLISKEDADHALHTRDRVTAAENAKAAVGISIHTDGSHDFGKWAEMYPQKVGLYRGSGSVKTIFNDDKLAKLSQSYTDTVKKSRDSIEMQKSAVTIKNNSYDDRAGIEPGNIPLVSLLAKTPWIYLEAGGKGSASDGGLNDKQIATYADAIVDGVQKAIPQGANTSTSANGCGNSTATTGADGLAATVLKYAWPEKHTPQLEMMPAYKEKIDQLRSEGGYYLGGDRYVGIDCGGFVTRLMVDSGFLPGYNYGGKTADGASSITAGTRDLNTTTKSQVRWARDNMQSLGHIDSTSKLQPGDVAMTSSHTFAFVGTIPGFSKTIASASLDERAPVAGSEDPLASDVIWFRKK